MIESTAFLLKTDADPADVLTRLEAADTERAFTLSTSAGMLRVSSQIGHATEDIRRFVLGAVGDAIDETKEDR